MLNKLRLAKARARNAYAEMQAVARFVESAGAPEALRSDATRLMLEVNDLYHALAALVDQQPFPSYTLDKETRHDQ